MKISKENLETLWYENRETGEKIPSMNGEICNPEGADIRVTRFPNIVRTSHYRLFTQEKVDKCKHPHKYVEPTYGWIDGIVGRRCKLCGGTQTKKKWHFWPRKWEGGGQKEIFEVNSSWNEDLVMAIANSGDYTLREAILIASIACERCMNALAYKYGLNDGYPEYSEEWKKCGTCCEFCKGEGWERGGRGGLEESQDKPETLTEPEEKKNESASTPSINMPGEMPYGKCGICGKEGPLKITYFHYPIPCSCHSPQHFLRFEHCADCEPKEPLYQKVEFKTEDLKNPMRIVRGILYEIMKSQDPKAINDNQKCIAGYAVETLTEDPERSFEEAMTIAAEIYNRNQEHIANCILKTFANDPNCSLEKAQKAAALILNSVVFQD